MAQYDDLNTRQIWIVGLLSTILTAITILAVHVLYYALLTRHEQLVSERSEYRQGNEYIATQLSQISSYGRDPETNQIRIPIERAMEIMVQEKGAVTPAPVDPAVLEPDGESDAPQDGAPITSEGGTGDDGVAPEEGNDEA